MQPKSLADIQNHAVAGLKAEFKKAASDARRSLRAQFEKNFLQTPALAGRGLFNLDQRTREMESKMLSLDFLMKGAESIYKPSDRSPCTERDILLWGDYLLEIKKHTRSAGSVATNGYVCENLLRQNGQKKMEARLHKFLKRRIGRELKNITAQ